MRFIFFLLFLTNVSYFLWQFTLQAPDDNESDQTVINGKGGLVLLAELADKERPPLHRQPEGESQQVIQTTVKPVSDAAQLETESGGMVCVEISMIRLRSDLDKLLAMLRERDVDVLEQGEENGVSINHWVILPPYRSRAEADSVAAKLTARRFTDFFIVRTGEYENAISLGVFSSEERAERRLAQVNALGLGVGEPRIELREHPASFYRLQYQVDSDVQTGIGGLASEYGTVRLKTCR